jgi:hypothetical protein
MISCIAALVPQSGTGSKLKQMREIETQLRLDISSIPGIEFGIFYEKSIDPQARAGLTSTVHCRNAASPRVIPICTAIPAKSFLL